MFHLSIYYICFNHDADDEEEEDDGENWFLFYCKKHLRQAFTVRKSHLIRAALNVNIHFRLV